MLTWAATGSAGWEVAVVNLLSPGDPVLAAVNGDFGERFARVAGRLGIEVRRLDVPWGEAVLPGQLRLALEAQPDVKAVFLVQNETSTGVTNPLRELAEVVRDHGALVVVDAVSAAGALPLEVDAWGIDFVFSGSQKAWMCPPGLLIVAAGPRAWTAHERSTYSRFFWDMSEAKKWADQGMTPTTPPLSMLFAFRAALDMIVDEGIEQVWERHRRLGRMTREGITAAGLQLFAQHGFESDSVTAFLPPPRRDGWRAAGNAPPTTMGSKPRADRRISPNASFGLVIWGGSMSRRCGRQSMRLPTRPLGSASTVGESKTGEPMPAGAPVA